MYLSAVGEKKFNGFENLLGQLANVDKVGPAQWRCDCPVHGGHTLQASKTDDGFAFLKCWAGCKGTDIAQRLGLTPTCAEDNWCGFGSRTRYVVAPDKAALTLSQLAAEKGFPEMWLVLEGVQDMVEGAGVCIKYMDEGGAVKAHRLRLALRAKDGSRWRKGDSGMPYGLWHLRDWRAYGWKTLWLVEGETDCWTLWSIKQAALGLPGASTYPKLTLDHVRQFDVVNVWHEPDSAGSKFLAGVSARLRAVGFQGAINVASLQGVKDPNDWWKAGGRNGGKFAPALVPVDEYNLTVPETLTAFKLADQLEGRHGDALRYNVDDKRWMVWDGRRYAADADHTAALVVQEHLRELRRRTQHETNEHRRAVAVKEVEKFEHPEGVGRVLGVLRPRLAVRWADLDTDPHLLTVANGLVDLRTGDLSTPGTAPVSKLVPVEYDPAAACPEWEAFLAHFQPDPEVRAYLQRAAGASLFGLPAKDVFFLYGESANNGKSTFLRALSECSGQYGWAADVEMFAQKRMGGAHPAEVAELAGRRCVVTSETSAGRSLDVALIKRVTSGAPMSGHRKYGNPFQFMPTFKLWIEGNHKPVLQGDDEGIWNRLHVIPWDVQIDPAKRVGDYFDRTLRPELAGVLAWMVRGAVAWWADGGRMGTPPGCVAEARNLYRSEMDTFGQWADERLTFGTSSKFKERRDVVYENYKNWCKQSGFHEMNIVAFGRKLAHRYPVSMDAGRRHWVGVQVRTEAEVVSRMDNWPGLAA